MTLRNSTLLQQDTEVASGLCAGTNNGTKSEHMNDDLSRKVFGLLGICVDATDFAELMGYIKVAAAKAAPYLISTPNVNFLVKSYQNSEFRESILLSDLSLVDGMPLIWIARLLRVPIHERIAGSDLFGKLKSTKILDRPLKVFLLGGAEGVAAKVKERINAEKCDLQCVGVLNPGFGSIEEMSSRQIIDTINSSEADLLAVFFGAEKAQAWLMHNHCQLKTPIRAQFGATINFEAGTINRAPPVLRSTGFEWLWRIKEEPYLWRRYWSDGKMLFRLIVECVIPLMWDARMRRRASRALLLEVDERPAECTVKLAGDAVADNIQVAIQYFGIALKFEKNIVVDISRASDIDSRFFGLFLMLKKSLANQGRHLRIVGASPELARAFRLNKFEFLLWPEL